MDFQGRDLAPQHVRLIERAAARYLADPEALALFVGGSVAHGYARADSDVDVIVVVAEERPERTLFDAELADYEGGYLDGKVVTRAYLEDVAERGGEAARWALKDAIPVFARDDSLAALLERAATYPEADRESKLRTFVAHLIMGAWYAGEADRRTDPYLTLYAASRVTLFAARAVLAHNRMLYPFHKWLLPELERAPEKPAQLLELLDLMLRAPSGPNAQRLVDAVLPLVGVDMTAHEASELYVELTEWAWRDGRSAPGEL